MATTTATQIQQLYVGLLGRAADQGGLNWWVDQVTTGGRTLEDIRASFVTSTEYTTTYGAATTRTDLVTAIYSNLFERTPSADELAYWVSTDTRPADQLVTAFLEFASTADQAVINNKTFVAQTYTDTVGTGFSAEGAAAVIADVDGTPASVTAALAAISGGTLPGQVAGLALINAQNAAIAAEAAFETSNKAAVDALATKLGVAIVADFDDNLDAVSTKANGNLTAAAGGKTLNVLTAEQKDAVDAQAAIRTDLDAAGKTKADAYVKAVAANAALKAATESDVAAAQAGLEKDTGYTAALDKVTATVPAVTDVETLYGYYTAATTTASQRSAIDTEFGAVSKFAIFKSTAATDITKNAAIKAEADTKADADADFVDAVTDTAVATKAVDDYKAAAADKAAVDAIVTPHDAVEKAVADAAKAIVEFNSGSADTELKVLANATTTVNADADVKETFYFAAKLNSSDFAIGGATEATHFGAGDSIVLGNDYTFNSGALSTGKSDALEFFLVKGTNDTQIVIENAAYGNASTTLNADGSVNASPDATVITLTGVTADHVSVANGVISYV